MPPSLASSAARSSLVISQLARGHQPSTEALTPPVIMGRSFLVWEAPGVDSPLTSLFSSVSIGGHTFANSQAMELEVDGEVVLRVERLSSRAHPRLRAHVENARCGLWLTAELYDENGESLAVLHRNVWLHPSSEHPEFHVASEDHPDFDVIAGLAEIALVTRGETLFNAKVLDSDHIVVEESKLYGRDGTLWETTPVSGELVGQAGQTSSSGAILPGSSKPIRYDSLG